MFRPGNWLHSYQAWLGRQERAGRAVLLILLGAFAATSQAPYYFVPGFMIAFTSLIWLLDAIPRTGRQHPKPRRAAFWTAWFFAFGYLLLSLYWLAFSFAVHGEGAVMKGALWGVGFVGTALLCGFMACFYGAALAVAIRWWPARLGNEAGFRAAGARLVLFIIAWSLAEYARGHLLTGLPWNLTGQIFAGNIIMAQSSALLGPYGIGLIALGLAVLPSNMTLSRRIVTLSGLTGALLICSVAGYGMWRVWGVPEPGTDPSVSIRIVQPNIVQTDKIDPGKFGANFNRALSMSVAPGAGSRPGEGVPPRERVIIWPENAAYDFFQSSPEARRAISDALPENTTLLSGAIRRVQGESGALQFYNTMLVMVRARAEPALDHGSRRARGHTRQAEFVIQDHFDKHHLAPFGEYLPFSELIRALGLDGLVPFGDGFQPGVGPRTLPVAGGEVAPIICYETIFPGRAYPKSGIGGALGAAHRPDWLVTVTNDAWFGDSAGPLQHLAQSRLRSIETGLPMMRAANTGISAAIDAKGRIIARLPLYTEGVLDTPLLKPVSPPPYSRLGDLLYWIGVMGMGVCLAGYCRRDSPAGSGGGIQDQE